MFSRFFAGNCFAKSFGSARVPFQRSTGFNRDLYVQTRFYNSFSSKYEKYQFVPLQQQSYRMYCDKTQKNGKK